MVPDPDMKKSLGDLANVQAALLGQLQLAEILPTIPKYEGDGAARYRLWKRAIAQLEDELTTDMLKKVIQKSVKGAAAQALSLFLRSQNGDKLFANVCKYLEEQFLLEGDKFEALTQLQSICQYTNEHPVSFKQRVLELSFSAYGDEATEAYRKKDMVQVFLRGLKDKDVARELFDENHQDLDTVTPAAVKLLARKNMFRRSDSPVNTDLTCVALEQVENQVKSLTKQLMQLTGKESRRINAVSPSWENVDWGKKNAARKWDEPRDSSPTPYARFQEERLRGWSRKRDYAASRDRNRRQTPTSDASGSRDPSVDRFSCRQDRREESPEKSSKYTYFRLDEAGNMTRVSESQIQCRGRRSYDDPQAIRHDRTLSWSASRERDSRDRKRSSRLERVPSVNYVDAEAHISISRGNNTEPKNGVPAAEGRI